MQREKCPKCKRDTYSKKFSQCSACGYGHAKGEPTPLEVVAENEASFTRKMVPENPEVTVSSTVGFYDPDRPIVREPVVELVMGEPCPTCFRKVTEKSTERVKAFRERKKG